MKLDEIALRNESFSAGVKIKLGDGQEWWFPKPIIEFRLSFEDGKPAQYALSRPTYGLEYWALFDEFVDADGALDQASALANLAIYLLRRNYNLSNDDMAKLLPYIGDDEEAVSIWREIADIAMGNGKKA